MDVDPSPWGKFRGLESVFQNLDELILECRVQDESHRHLVEQINLSIRFNGWRCWTTKSGRWLRSNWIFLVFTGSGFVLALVNDCCWKVVFRFFPLLMFWLILPQGPSHGVEVDLSCVSVTASNVQLNLLVMGSDRLVSVRGRSSKCLSVSMCVSVSLCLCASLCLSLSPSVCLSVSLSLSLSVSLCLSICLPACLSVCLSACLSVCLPVCLASSLRLFGCVCVSGSALGTGLLWDLPGPLTGMLHSRKRVGNQRDGKSEATWWQVECDLCNAVKCGGPS